MHVYIYRLVNYIYKQIQMESLYGFIQTSYFTNTHSQFKVPFVMA